MFHICGHGAPAYCRLTWSEWSKPATCRRSGLSAFRAEHEICELDVPQSGKREPTVSQNWRFGQNKRTLVIPLKPGHTPAATVSMPPRTHLLCQPAIFSFIGSRKTFLPGCWRYATRPTKPGILRLPPGARLVARWRGRLACELAKASRPASPPCCRRDAPKTRRRLAQCH
jgi:hypothetical protein